MYCSQSTRSMGYKISLFRRHFCSFSTVDARASEATQATIRAARVHNRVILVQYRLVVQTARLEKPRLPLKLVVV